MDTSVGKKEPPETPQGPAYEEAFRTLRQLPFSDRREWNEQAKNATTALLEHIAEKNSGFVTEIRAAEELIRARRREMEAQNVVLLFMEIYRAYSSGQRTAYLIRTDSRTEADGYFQSLIQRSHHREPVGAAKEAEEKIIQNLGAYLHSVFQHNVSIFQISKLAIRYTEDKVSVTIEDYGLHKKEIKFDSARVFGLEKLKGANPTTHFLLYEFMKKKV